MAQAKISLFASDKGLFGEEPEFMGIATNINITGRLVRRTHRARQ
jgi:hypothetical protein